MLNKFWLASGVAIALWACTAEPSARGGTFVEAELPNIIISDARVRPPLPGRNIAAGYFQLTSNAPDRLLAVSSPMSERVELHTHIEDNGIIRMRRLQDGIEITKDSALVFAPGGLHIMLFDTAITSDTGDISLTFDFETAPDVTIIADIDQPNAHPDDSHGSGYGSDHGSSHGLPPGTGTQTGE